VFHDYVAAVGEDAQLGERALALARAFRSGRPASAGGDFAEDAFFDELLGGAQA